MAVTVTSAAEAARLIPDGSTVTVCGVVGGLVPEAVLRAVEERYLQEGHPRQLTVYFPVAVGDVYDLPGLDHLAHEGLARRFIGGSYVIGRSPKTGRRSRLTELVLENRVEAYNFPIGALMHLLREIAGGRPGVVTPIGLDTFVDPRHEGGKLNARTTEDLVEVVSLGGQEYLWYRAFPVDVAIIRATTADEAGNLTFEHEGLYSGTLAQAMAAHNSGGIVIAQVQRLAARGSLHPQMVRVPGELVDVVVVDPDQVQGTGVHHDPTVTGAVRAPRRSLGRPIPLTPDAIVARRALLALAPGQTVVLGFGAPSLLPWVALEEGVEEALRFTIEHGAVGGLPLDGLQFGVSANPECILATPEHFDYIGGGGFDVACLAFAEVDPEGSVNVSKLPGLIPGCGGFIDITHRAPRIVFAGTFTTGGLAATASDGKLRIEREGQHVKFVRRLHQRTFSGPRALRQGQRITLVTERAVFELTSDGLVLTEIAPGVDLHQDVLERMQFRPIVSPDLRLMEARLFQPDPVGVATAWTT
jgi:propionate CoA-transferase